MKRIERMVQRRRRTMLRGALIYVALVLIAGCALAVGGHVSDPLTFVQALQSIHGPREQSSALPNVTDSQPDRRRPNMTVGHTSANRTHAAA